MAFQNEQFSELGISFEHIDAVSPTSAETPPQLPFEALGNHARFWKGRTAAMSLGKMGCLVSHLNLWVQILHDGPAVILEDDVIIAKQFAKTIEKLKHLDGIDYINLEATPLPRHLAVSPHKNCSVLYRMISNVYFSGGYILWPRGAELLLRSAKRGGDAVDSIIRSNVRIVSYQVSPAVVMQAQFSKQHSESPIFLISAISADDEVNCTAEMKLRQKWINFVRWCVRQRFIARPYSKRIVPFGSDAIFPKFNDIWR